MFDNGLWKIGPELPANRGLHTLVQISASEVMLIGGASSQFGTITLVWDDRPETYSQDTVTETWTARVL